MDRSHKKGQRNRANRRRRDSDPESSGRRNAAHRKEERHRSKPSDSPPSSCPRVVLLRPAATVTAAAGSASPSRSQSPLSQPLSDEPADAPIFPVRPVVRKEHVREQVAVRKDVPQPESCIKLIDPQTWAGLFLPLIRLILTQTCFNS